MDLLRMIKTSEWKNIKHIGPRLADSAWLTDMHEANPINKWHPYLHKVLDDYRQKMGEIFKAEEFFDTRDSEDTQEECLCIKSMSDALYEFLDAPRPESSLGNERTIGFNIPNCPGPTDYMCKIASIEVGRTITLLEFIHMIQRICHSPLATSIRYRLAYGQMEGVKEHNEKVFRERYGVESEVLVWGLWYMFVGMCERCMHILKKRAERIRYDISKYHKEVKRSIEWDELVGTYYDMGAKRKEMDEETENAEKMLRELRRSGDVQMEDGDGRDEHEEDEEESWLARYSFSEDEDEEDEEANPLVTHRFGKYRCGPIASVIRSRSQRLVDGISESQSSTVQ
jgi:hypothetical protein